jgi:ceramide glucosyltransferase
MGLLTIVLAFVATAGIALAVATSLLVVRFLERRLLLPDDMRYETVERRFSIGLARSRHPRVSILKPLCGEEDQLLENLASFATLRDLSYEVIFSVADPDDPAVPIAREVIARHPRAPFRLVIEPDRPGAMNPKIERLAAAARHAAGEIILISDANVRVQEADLAETIAGFNDPTVGCISNTFTGFRSRTFGAKLESLHLLTFVIPGTVLAARANVPCVVGKSMAIRSSVLKALGGFEQFRDRLAEDQAIGLAVRASGYRVTVSSVVVRNVVVDRSVARAFARQVRWNKIRYSFSPALYAAEFLMNPFPIALLAAGTAGIAGSALLAPSLMIAMSIALARVAQAMFLCDGTKSDLRTHDCLLMPLSDLVQFAAQWVPYFSKTVRWKAHSTRLSRGTVMQPVDRRRAA